MDRLVETTMKARLTKIGTLKCITLQSPSAQARFVLDFGGVLNSLRFRKRGRWIETIDAPRTEAGILANKWYASAKLFPFPGRIKDGKYALGKKRMSLNRNFPSQGHAIHGLVYDKRWKVRRVRADSGSISLTIGVRLRPTKGYPFSLDVSCEYLLRETMLTCITRIKNLGSVAAPYGDGWHPYFSLVGSKASIQASISKTLVTDQRMIPTGTTRAYPSRLNISYVDGFKHEGGIIDNTFIMRHNVVSMKSASYTLTMRGDKQYRFFQIFTPPGRRSVAIEPMTCWPDAFNNRKGLRILRPGASFIGTYTVQLR